MIFFLIEENELLHHIILFSKCDQKYAELIISKMKNLGLNLCLENLFGFALVKFANMRGYINEEEVQKIHQRIQEQHGKRKKEDNFESTDFNTSIKN